LSVSGDTSSASGLTFLGVRIEVQPISPTNMRTALQVVCFFDWRKNTVMTGGSGELDHQLGHALLTLRQEDHFRGEELESLLLRPPPGQVSPERILLMGLGDPASLSTSTLVRVGRMATLEAMRLNVSSFSLAPDIKDAGIAFPGADASASLVTGMFQALETAERLHELRVADRPKLTGITLLAGHEHLSTAEEGLQIAIRRARSA